MNGWIYFFAVLGVIKFINVVRMAIPAGLAWARRYFDWLNAKVQGKDKDKPESLASFSKECLRQMFKTI